ncbi:type I secretion C-terminal target domain-containing protein [Leptolyngbya ohadii]|uniref:type I secretion C-terminal target domain-containing protein n=1 Tax=Leptolyngbya ohadii TaxID=1962290 RepID=UPI000B5A176D|nr:type I secretion C-terminal target domain-containing protein [Leptolyngbya ohadii]
MTVVRFPLSDPASGSANSPSLQNDDSGMLTIMPAPEDLLSDEARDLIVTTIQPLQGNGRLSVPTSFNEIIGTPGNDVLRGTNRPDLIEGRAGNDRLLAEGASDSLFGDGGNDRLFGGRRDDRLFGGNGNDRLFGDQGNDELSGGSGRDELRGNNGNDVLEGGAARDSLFGGNGADRLVGQGARDLLLGGRGDDVLIGGRQPDRLAGGGGTNRFVYNSFEDRGDTITDFDRRRDVLDLSRLFQGDNFTSSDKFEDYVIIVRDDEETTIIRVDADGNGGDQPFKTLATLENVEFDDIGRRNFVF